jgi:1-deoxy-D-xylulose-5-phosphate reductoisomerase
MTKKVTLLGSTGSIGLSALRVIKLLQNEYSVYGLSCGKNIEELKKQIAEFNPSVVAVASAAACKSEAYLDLKKKYDTIEFLEGEEGTVELAKRNSDLLVSAIVGAAGLRPTIAAIGNTGRIALANKETLVIAGDIVMKRIRESGAELVPVDSEHSAVFSLTQNIRPEDIERIVLTASGGSLRGVDIKVLKNVTPRQALDHPTWDMGAKITIDSATLMNKGLEVIEAHYLFDIDYDKVDVVIHPESIVHSLVETIDGAFYAHLGVADMALPILNAFTWPQKVANPFGRLDLEKVGSLQFLELDDERYPALSICYEAGKTGGTMPAVLNASNEIAVNAFLNGKILFTDIVKIVEKTMRNHSNKRNPDLEDILQADSEARDLTTRIIKGEQ